MRMSMRLTNAFSKKVENLTHAVSLHFMFYNFGRIHKSLRVTPAMETGITDHVRSLEGIAGLIGYPIGIYSGYEFGFIWKLIGNEHFSNLLNIFYI